MVEQPQPDEKRQRVVRVAGARRARLTPAPGSDPQPESPLQGDEPVVGPKGPKGPKGPNDDRLVQDVPPHY